MKEKMINRFLEYSKINTMSNPNSNKFPSTKEQKNLANLLYNQLQQMGIEVNYNENGYIFASIPATKGLEKLSAVGFIAHLDTAPDMTGEKVSPQIIKNYQGQTITLNNQYSLSPEDFPSLNNYIGNTIITTDGTTLLGADDKAGIAEIMEAIQYIVNNNIKHGPIKIAFTPDEEIGKGTEYFDVKEFGADFAYTIDGGEIGELQFENFNAGSVVIEVEGRNVHPGDAKNKMINAQEIAIKIHNSLPVFERPEYTDDYEGFYHLIESEGNVSNTQYTYIIRDHDKNKYNQKKEMFLKTINQVKEQYPNVKIKCIIEDTYFNMKEKIEDKPEIIEIAKKAFLKAEVEPKLKPIRGGTDGSNLSFKGLPCPNIFTGGHNFHGRYEYISVESMLKAKEIIINIIEEIVNSKTLK